MAPFEQHGATVGREPKRGSPCPLCLPSLSTEGTERLSDLCVEALLARENTEILLTGGENFARGEETQP
jgi:hypothetical protein